MVSRMRWNPHLPAAWLRLSGLLTLLAATATADVRLNEIVSSNGGSLRDASGATPDWIELHNDGPTVMELEGYGLSDREDAPFKWVFPRRRLAVGEFLIVFASGRDQRAGELHTNFSLSRGGETVVLTAPDGTQVDVVPAVVLRRDVSFGRDPAHGSWRFFPKPTPRAANVGSSYAEILHEAPTVVQAGGFYEAPIDVSLASMPPGSEVRYTLDGSEPTEASPLWPEHVSLGERTGENAVLAWIEGTSIANQHTDGWKPPLGPVRLAHVLRVRAFKPGALPSPVTTHTYFIGAAARVEDGLPVLSIASAPHGLFDDEEGIYMLGKVFADYVATHPNEPLTGHTPANYTQRGAAWSRAASVELFEPNGTRAVSAVAHLDIKGQSSRSFRQKTFGLDFKTDQAEALEYPLFPGHVRSGDGTPLASFETLRLRNFGNDWAYAAMRDAYCHQLVRGLGLDVMAWRPVSVFLNGEYWGVLEAREQQDAAYFAAHYGVDAADLAILNGDGSVLEGNDTDREAFLALRIYAETHDLAQPEALAYVAARMDVENFLRYQLAEVFCGNADWPHNNTRMWRRRRADDFPERDTVPRGHDGRWRWMIFDLDLAVAHPWAGGYGENTLSFAVSPTGRPGAPAPWATSLLRSLLRNPTVKARFATLAADALNSRFKATQARALVDEMAGILAPALPEHFRRWNLHNGQLAGWQSYVQPLRTWASQREVNVRQHFTTELSLGGYATLTVDRTPAEGGVVQVNNLLINHSLPGVTEAVYPWRGTYFRQVSVTLKAQPLTGYVFEKWTTPSGESTEPELTLNLTASTPITAHFRSESSSAPMSWTAVTQRPDGVELDFRGAPGITYQLLTSADLREWTWHSDFVTDSEGLATVVLPPPRADSLFLQAQPK